MTFQSILHSKKGLTVTQIIGITSVIVLALILTFYLATKKPATFQEITNTTTPTTREPPVAKIIASYDKEYDTNEYCADDEIYDVQCEETCDTTRNGRELKPQTAFVDCKAPKHCCQYQPQEWPSFDAEPE